MQIRISFDVVLFYFAGGLLGLIVALVILHAFYILEMAGREEHTFLYHWLNDQSPTHAPTILAGFVIMGFLAAGWIAVKDWLKAQKAKARALGEISQAKTEMVSFVSHQLRAPISSLKWGLKLLLGGECGHLSGEQKDILTKLYKTNEDLKALVTEFLDASKLEAERLEIAFKAISLADLEEELKEVAEGLKPLIKEKNIHFNYLSFLNHKLFIPTDLKRISQVVETLLENAIAYTLPGGEIKIRLENDSTNFKFSISDTGIGIPKGEQSRIFQKFFRAKNARKMKSTGTGLGLYLCQKFIEGHRGEIWFLSKEGKGTTFSFTIPLKAKVEIAELFKKI